METQSDRTEPRTQAPWMSTNSQLKTAWERKVYRKEQRWREVQPALVVIECPLLREEGRRPRTGLLTEGLNEEIE